MKRGQTALGFDALQVGRIFETPNGKAGVLEAQDGVGRIVYRVTSAEVPPAANAASATTDAALSSGLQDDLLVQYVQKVQSDLGVSVNEAAIRSATGADRN
jgi:peptidyl-prolyl cis-trans isomerase D